MGRILHNAVAKPKDGYKTLRHLIQTHELPLTFHVSCFDRKPEARENGCFTIHRKEEITVLKCCNKNGNVCYISNTEINEETFTKINIVHERNFESLENLKLLKKERNITYFVATKKFDHGNDVFNPGQIFCFSTQNTKLLSFRREKIRGIHVLTYPDMKKIFLPLVVKGDFKQCDEPGTNPSKSLDDVSKEVPFLLLKHSDKNFDWFYVTETAKVVCLYASKKTRDNLEMHVFSVTEFTQAKVLSEVSPVDTLDESEIKKVFKTAKYQISNEQIFNGFYKTFSYSELGISRLLDEIFSQLKHTRPMSLIKKREVLMPYQSKKLRSIDFSQLCISRLNRNQCEADNFYINTNTLNDSKKKELFVEFDDGGYVIIPYVGNLPKIKSESLYHSTDNAAYNYGRSDSFEDHVYTYIGDDVINREIPDYRLQSSMTGPCESDRSSYIYDYSYTNEFRLPEVLSKQYLKDLSCDQVGDILESLQLKNHVSSLREKTITGKELIEFDGLFLKSINFNLYETEKLMCFINGWRPLKKSKLQLTWMSKLPCDWSIDDVSKYLLHIDLRSFQRFASSQQIDGFFLRHIVINVKILESLKFLYGVNLSNKDIERLKANVLDDGTPKFKYVR